LFVATSELNKTSQRRFNNLVQLLEREKLSLCKLSIAEVTIDNLLDSAFEICVSLIDIRVSVTVHAHDTGGVNTAATTVSTTFLSDQGMQMNVGCNLLKNEHSCVIILLVDSRPTHSLCTHINAQRSLEEILEELLSLFHIFEHHDGRLLLLIHRVVILKSIQHHFDLHLNEWELRCIAVNRNFEILLCEDMSCNIRHVSDRIRQHRLWLRGLEHLSSILAEENVSSQ